MEIRFVVFVQEGAIEGCKLKGRNLSRNYKEVKKSQKYPSLKEDDESHFW